MFRYIDTQEQLPKRKAWTHKDSGVQYCRRFLEAATTDDLSAVGVEFIPDPEPPAPDPLQVIDDVLGMSDNRLMRLAARMLEDIAEERKAAGKFVHQAVQDEIAFRKAKREERRAITG